MDLYGFFNSFPGNYMAQSAVHSVLALSFSTAAIVAWRIKSPAGRQRLYLMAVAFPALAWPVYTLVNPERGSLHFRTGALFDTGRWLFLEPLGVQLAPVFLLACTVSAAVFFIQELLPVARESVFARREEKSGAVHGHPRLSEAAAGLAGKISNMYVLPEDDYVLFSTTGRAPAVFISSGLLEDLGPEQLKAALAHELAHIERSRRPVLVIAWLLRVAMFFNPVVLLGFRRVVQEEEKICDESAVRATQNPLAVAGLLRHFLPSSGPGGQAPAKGLARPAGGIEEYSRGIFLLSRIGHIEEGPAPEEKTGWARLALTAGAMALTGYYVA